MAMPPMPVETDLRAKGQREIVVRIRAIAERAGAVAARVAQRAHGRSEVARPGCPRPGSCCPCPAPCSARRVRSMHRRAPCCPCPVRSRSCPRRSRRCRWRPNTRRSRRCRNRWRWIRYRAHSNRSRPRSTPRPAPGCCCPVRSRSRLRRRSGNRRALLSAPLAIAFAPAATEFTPAAIASSLPSPTPSDLKCPAPVIDCTPMLAWSNSAQSIGVPASSPAARTTQALPVRSIVNCCACAAIGASAAKPSVSTAAPVVPLSKTLLIKPAPEPERAANLRGGCRACHAHCSSLNNHHVFTAGPQSREPLPDVWPLAAQRADRRSDRSPQRAGDAAAPALLRPAVAGELGVAPGQRRRDQRDAHADLRHRHVGRAAGAGEHRDDPARALPPGHRAVPRDAVDLAGDHLREHRRAVAGDRSGAEHPHPRHQRARARAPRIVVRLRPVDGGLRDGLRQRCEPRRGTGRSVHRRARERAGGRDQLRHHHDHPRPIDPGAAREPRRIQRARPRTAARDGPARTRAGATAPRTETGSHRAPGQRYRARLQQHPPGDPGIRGAARQDPRHRGCAGTVGGGGKGHGRGRSRRPARLGPRAQAARLQPPRPCARAHVRRRAGDRRHAADVAAVVPAGSRTRVPRHGLAGVRADGPRRVRADDPQRRGQCARCDARWRALLDSPVAASGRRRRDRAFGHGPRHGRRGASARLRAFLQHEVRHRRHGPRAVGDPRHDPRLGWHDRRRERAGTGHHVPCARAGAGRRPNPRCGARLRARSPCRGSP